MKSSILGWLFVISFGCLLSPSCPAFTITLFPAKEVYRRNVDELNGNLGLKDRDLIVEDFENEQLIAGLTTNLKGGFEVAGAPTAWDGAKTSTYEREAEFKFSLPDIRLFGIGLGDNDAGDEVLSINGGPFIILQNLPHHVSDSAARAYYLTVEAEPGDPDISSISIRRGFTIAFDHLALRQSKREPNRPLHFAVDLVDGSRLIGSSSLKAIKIDVSGNMIEIPVERIANLQSQPEKRMISMALRNGDKVTGRVEFDGLSLKTILGEMSLGLDKVERITIQETIQEQRQRELDVLSFEPEHNSTWQAVRLIERDRITVKSLQARYEALLTNLKRLPKAAQRKAIPTAFPDVQLTELLSKLAAAENEFAVQTEETGPNHSKIIQLSAVMTNLNGQIDARVEGILTGLETLAQAQEARAAKLVEEENRLRQRDAELMEKYRPYFQAKRDQEARKRIEETIKLGMLHEAVDASLPRAPR